MQATPKSLDGIWANFNIQMSSINRQTPIIIYPSVVFFSIRIVPITEKLEILENRIWDTFHNYTEKVSVLIKTHKRRISATDNKHFYAS